MLTIIHHAALAGHTAALRRRRPNSAMLMSLDRRMLNDVGISWDDAVGVSRAGLTIRRSPLLD